MYIISICYHNYLSNQKYLKSFIQNAKNNQQNNNTTSYITLSI